MASSAPKRGPSILVTDAREQQRLSSGSGERPGLSAFRRPTSRFITVDNVLQYTSDIPSAQARTPPRPRNLRTPLGRQTAQPKPAGRSAPTPAIPSRTTKVSEKLVLLPETEEGENGIDGALGGIEKDDFDEDNNARPERDGEAYQRGSGGPAGRKSYAERLTKARRAEKFSRVTAYCTAQAFRLSPAAAFLRDVHGARAKLYDDCLYVVYHLPLLPGGEGYRIRSSPVLKHPGGKAVLDLEIERNEQRDYGEGFFEDDRGERYSIRGDEGNSENDKHGFMPAGALPYASSPESGVSPDYSHDRPRRQSDGDATAASPQGRLAPDSLSFAEMYIFSYGVVVFWNFTENQEKDVLADLTFFQTSAPHQLRLNSMTFGQTMNSSVHSTFVPSASRIDPGRSRVSTRISSLVINPLPEEDFETEEFHFEYDTAQPRPRIFNDMITLRSGDHMLKLTLSHAIAQSTKLSFFEQQMARQMAEAQHVPKTLALTGTLGMKRGEVFRILGALFRSRVDVNLSSSVLDTPDFFWSDEPPLLPLYASMRTYLEIDPRVKTLNERCQVFLDLAEILSDNINDTKMSTLTWIIIILILISIAVTCSEVFLRFGLLSKGDKGISNLAEGTEVVRVVLENGTRYLVANGIKFVPAMMQKGNDFT